MIFLASFISLLFLHFLTVSRKMTTRLSLQLQIDQDTEKRIEELQRLKDEAADKVRFLKHLAFCCFNKKTHKCWKRNCEIE